MKEKMKILDLFSGIGGFSLGLESTGHFETTAFCEIDKFCKLILNKHWKGKKIYDDVKEITKEKFKEDGIDFPDIITGGFPCQPFSVAGKQQGTSDSRHLWPEMFRIIKDFSPRWVIGENVKGLTNIQDGMVFETVCTDLEGEGYEVRTFNIPAAGVQAPHRRERLWIVAHAKRFNERKSIRGSYETQSRIQEEHRQNDSTTREPSRTGSVWGTNNGHENMENSRRTPQSNVADTERKRLEGLSEHSTTISRQDQGTYTGDEDSSGKIEGTTSNSESIGSDVGRHEQYQEERSGQGEIGGASSQDDANSYGKRLEGFRGEHKLRNSEEEEQTSRDGWWSVEPNVGRVAHGIPGRVHRLKGLGNSIVPQIVEEIGKALIKAERTN